jgi:hypothetical protein
MLLIETAIIITLGVGKLVKLTYYKQIAWIFKSCGTFIYLQNVPVARRYPQFL